MPPSVPIIFGFCAFLYLSSSRMLIRSYYHWLATTFSRAKKTLIYGAGKVGAQIALSLQTGSEYRLMGFLDDDPKKANMLMGGVRVYPAENVEQLLDKYHVDVVLVAINGLDSVDRKRILKNLSKFPVKVKIIPSTEESIDGDDIEKLRSVEIEDILGREKVAPDDVLLRETVLGKSICITGAGGSIGSELARQTLVKGASKLILFEINEYALYKIEREISERAARTGTHIEIYAILGSVLDQTRLTSVYENFGVNTVFHAAAYKHVPIVERNVLQGLENNVIGTYRSALSAQQAGVDRFILISTDKAVRPTNVMGASKRFAELCVQALDKSDHSKTVFSMVRFGNVLGSSGSVVPLFREQIEKGGPITVTHPEINRYFMTIPEAASLVIQAGAMARGGEVFVLDMGEPIQISKLAETMIHLSGLRVKNDTHPDGDIEISYTGLRPGEKLYEELLIGGDVINTSHSKILCAQEISLSLEAVKGLVDQAEKAVSRQDSSLGREILGNAVKEFVPNPQDADILHGAVRGSDKELQ